MYNGLHDTSSAYIAIGTINIKMVSVIYDMTYYTVDVYEDEYICLYIYTNF